MRHRGIAVLLAMGSLALGACQTTNGSERVLAVERPAPTPVSTTYGNIGPADARIQLVYVGAADCPGCRSWKPNDLPALKASVAGPYLRIREIWSDQLYNVVDDSIWPEDLRGLRDEWIRARGAPQYLLLFDGNVVLKEHGNYNFGIVTSRMYSLARQLRTEEKIAQAND